MPRTLLSAAESQGHRFMILDALVEVKAITGEEEREGSLLG